MTIVRLNGTHGSGKSTVATKIMEKYGAEAVWASEDVKRKRPLGYTVRLQADSYLWVVGPYVSACGGCDAIQPFADIWPRVMMGVDDRHHILFEGALLSTTYGAIGKEMEQQDDVVWAFMDTPMEVCHDRVNARRAARGAGPLTDFKNVDGKWHTIRRLRDKLAAGDVGGIGAQTVADIRHTHPVTDVLKLFGVRITKEPK